MRAFTLVVGVDCHNGIGKNGTVPWKCRRDMNFFKHITMGPAGSNNVVIMGRKTWDSIPDTFRPLPSRYNIVISSSDRLNGDVQPHAVAKSLDAALSLAGGLKPPPAGVFLIGGTGLFVEGLKHPLCNGAFVTRVVRRDAPTEGFECDTFFPPEALDEQVYALNRTHPAYTVFEETPNRDDEPIATLDVYTRINNDEAQYLDLITRILRDGSVRPDRTGVGTRAVFGAMTRWNLRHGRLPLLTTKRVFTRGVVEELLWFLRGCTDAQQLANKGVRIWDGNGSREFLDKLGFTDRRVGDLGPVYGFQWRHFGAEYRGPDADYTRCGVDQIAELIEGIRKDPYGRRHLITAWNPTQIKEMVLPPCHVMAQFFVADGELSCMLTQRSCDVGLGVPFNVASYALLTHIVAHVCGLRAGELVHSMGDTHIYANHVEPLTEQTTRTPRAFPVVHINSEVKDIDALQGSDIVVLDYEPDAAIKMPMAV